jgi:uncharacterized protein (UPF0264 family)
MTRPFQLPHRPGLLVSVRNADEALAALTGGADIIDVKEPARGSLGPASTSTIVDVVRAINGRAPVTAAAGELLDLCRGEQPQLPAGLSLLKIGLAGCRGLPNWRSLWYDAVSSLVPRADAFTQTVAVAYADWRAANAPNPHDVLQLAVEARCPALLIDTFDKSAGTLFDVWPAGSIRGFVEKVRSHDIMTVLAGSLTGDSIAAAARLEPDLIAVRTAACEAGRNSAVCRGRVQSLRKSILNITPTGISAETHSLQA